MGLGCNEEQRNLVIGSAYFAHKIDKKTSVSVPCNALVVDGPAVCRSFLCRPVSAAATAKAFVKQWEKKFGLKTSLKSVSIFFDFSNEMPPQRAEVNAERSKHRTEMTETEKLVLKSLKLDSESPALMGIDLPWEIIFKSSEAKKKAWKILARAFFEELCAVDSLEIFVVSESFQRSRFVRTKSTVLDQKYGEADMMVALRAEELLFQGNDVVISTIDFDQLLQALVFSNCLHSKNKLFLSFQKEIVNANSLVAKYGGIEINKRLSASFFLLMAFKSDYSKPVCRQVGMKTKEFIEVMNEVQKFSNDELPLAEETSTSGSRKIFVRPKKIVACLKDSKKLPDVNFVEKILWCLLYFRGYGSKKKTKAGPNPVSLTRDIFTKDLFVVEDV